MPQAFVYCNDGDSTLVISLGTRKKMSTSSNLGKCGVEIDADLMRRLFSACEQATGKPVASESSSSGITDANRESAMDRPAE